MKRIFGHFTRYCTTGLKLIPESVFGYLVLSFFLFGTSLVWPNFYRFITRWANDPMIPNITQCAFVEKGEPSDYFKQYTVSITLDQKPNTSEIVVYLPYRYRNKMSFVYKDLPTISNSSLDIASIILYSSKQIQFDVLIKDKDGKWKTNETKSRETCPFDILLVRS